MASNDTKTEEYNDWLKNRMEECIPNESDCSWCPLARDCERLVRTRDK
jgi:hypothetical protein